jgi:hypothetical protein
MHYRADGGIVCVWDGKPYSVTEKSNPDNWQVIQAYLAAHPEALIPEPVPPEPTQEELDRREEQSLLAYLASTDWYAVRFAETGQAIPEDVVTQRADARVRISELRNGD